MNWGRCLLTLCLILTTVTVLGQQRQRNQPAASVEIKGVVVEEGTDIPVEQATVRLLSVKDSTFIGGVASNLSGTFSLKNVKPGEYLLHVSFIGFDPLYQPLQITGRTNPVDVGKLGMSDGAILLSEAVAVGKAPEVTVRNDTIEYNADSYKVTEGSTLEDLLKKMPGVEVDEEGKITVNGKEVKKVLIDGKEFFTDDPKVASKNLPSNMVDKVQVLDRLSEMAQMTGFDDGDEETVINLTVKPGMKQGWFGNAFAGYGSKDRYEANGMVNRFINNDQITLMGGLNNTNNMGFSDLSSSFSGMGGGRGGFMGGGQNGITSSGNIGLNFSKEFNALATLGGNGRYSHSDNHTITNSTTENIMSDGTSNIEYGTNDRQNKSDGFGANFRLEWKPDSMTSLIFRPDFNYRQTKQWEYDDSYELNALQDTLSTNDGYYYSTGESYSINGRLEFSRKLNNDGRIFSASFNGGISDTQSDAFNDQKTLYFTEGKEDDIRDQNIKVDNSGFNYRGYLSWVEPIGRNNFVQLTYSLSQRKQDQFKNAYNLDEYDQYTIIDTTQTQNFRNNSIDQRASLSFKSVRAKFNYTIGFNVDPYYTSSERFIGDTVLYKIKKSGVNFSPTVQFRFNFSRQSNLRIDYNGRTSQPSMTQLQPVPDYSNARNVRIGNPDLKPRYQNNMFIRYQSFKPESQFALMVMANGGYTVNDIVNYTIYDADNSGFRTTTYDNINGNYNGNVRVMMNTPLKNKKFSVNSMTMVSFNNRADYIGNYEKGTDNIIKTKSSSKALTLMERAGIDYRSDYFDLGVNGNIRFNHTDYSLKSENNQEPNTFDYGVGGRTTIYLPYEFKIESDVNWSANYGYADGYKKDEVLWNAGISKSFLKGNQATLRLKFYDILKQRSNISRSESASTLSYTEYNTVTSYFMVHFIYRFSIFKGGATMNDAMGGRRGPGGPGGPGGPPPGRF